MIRGLDGGGTGRWPAGGMLSLHTARRAINGIGNSHEQRDAKIALNHAEEMAAVAERLFSSAVGEQAREGSKTDADQYADLTAEDLEPEVE